jgi:hypothetical protein
LTAIESISFSGTGLGWWAATHPGSFDEFAHSDALQAIVELGAGSLFFFAIPVLIFLRCYQPRAEMSAFVAICIESVISFPLHLPASGFLAAVLAGTLAGRGGEFLNIGFQSRESIIEAVRWQATFRYGLARRCK